MERTEEVTFPTVSTLSVTTPSVLEEEAIIKVSEELNDPLEFKVMESRVLGEELSNALVEVVEEEQVDVGNVMVSRVYTRQEAMNPGKIVTISYDGAHFLDIVNDN